MDWSTAPPWANYRTRDKDGVWWYWEKLPETNGSMWIPGVESEGNFEKVQYLTAWNESMEKRPANKVLKKADNAESETH